MSAAVATPLRLHEVLAALPQLDELLELRGALIARSQPDPQAAWRAAPASALAEARQLAPEALAEAVFSAQSTLHTYVDELFRRLQPCLAALARGEAAALAHGWIDLGRWMESWGLLERAERCYDAACAAALPLADKTPQIRALRRWARVQMARGALAEARTRFHRAAELAAAAGDPREEARALLGLGEVLVLQGAWDAAAATHRQAHDALERGDPTGRWAREWGRLFLDRGRLALFRRRWAEAEAWLDEARRRLPPPQEPAAAVDHALWHHCQGLLRRAQGREAEARRCWEAGLELPLPLLAWLFLVVDLILAYEEAGLSPLADEYRAEAERRVLAAHSPYALAVLYRALGNLGRLRRQADAFALFERALELARAEAYDRLEAEIWLDYARLRAAVGEREEALVCLDRAEALLTRLGLEPLLEEARTLRAAWSAP